MARPPQYGVALSSEELSAQDPCAIVYGVTPDNKFIPLKVDSTGHLVIGAGLTLDTDNLDIGDVVIKGVDPDNADAEQRIAVKNLGTGNGFAVKTALFNGANQLAIDGAGSIPVTGPLTDTQLRAAPVTITFPPYGQDLFGRVRTSAPQNLFSSQFLYDKQPLFWDELLVGTGASTFNSNTSSIALTVGVDSGARVVRQTKEYFTYEPNRAQSAAFTTVFGSAKANCRQMIGVFDDNDGCFIQADGTTFGVVIRSSTSGSPVETVIPQTNFNIDKLDGSGPSGKVIDLTKVQLFFIEYQWFGVGNVRFGVFFDGAIWYFHQESHSNISTTVYMKRGSLPLRYEIVNTGTTSGATTLTQICSAIQSEAGYDPSGVKRGADMGVTPKTIAGTGEGPLISIRLKAANIRAAVVPLALSILTTAANNFHYHIILNGTLTGASFTSVDSTSVVEVDTAATALTGGQHIASGYVSSVVRQEIAQSIHSLLKIVSNIAGVSDILTLYVENISSGITYYAGLDWQEFV